MNKSQLALAVESIEGDCDIRGVMKNEDGETCAMGGLAESAGFDAAKGHFAVISAVRKFYGLSYEDTSKIIRLNDKYAMKWTRVKHIAKYLNSLELE